MTNWNYLLGSQGGVITASNSVSGHGGFMANDGNDLTYWQPSSLGQNLVCDLGVPQYIETLRFYTIMGGAPKCASIVISYCNDNATWAEFGSRAIGLGENVIDIAGVTARYWKIVCTGGQSPYIQVGEVELIGPIEAPPPPANPAPEYIAAWLDGLEANYVPSVQDWLDAH